MHPVSLAIGFVVGCLSCAVYSLAHSAKLEALGAKIITEIQTLKAKV